MGSDVEAFGNESRAKLGVWQTTDRFAEQEYERLGFS